MSDEAPEARGRLSRLLDAVEERTGARTLFRWIAEEPLPGGARWAYVFGSVLVALLGAQMLSGVALAFDYAPTVAAAHASVARIMAAVPLGPIVRGMHHYGATFLVVGLVAHLVQVALAGAYRRPREANWLTGLGLALLVFGFAFTGYLLPWDETAYYATRVGLNIASSTPGLGPPLAAVLQGGSVMGNLTLTHFYVVHVIVLPALLLGLLAIHLALFRRHGVTVREARAARAEPHGAVATGRSALLERFWPHQAAYDGMAMAAAVVALVVVAALVPSPLGDKADPSVAFDARPEWYFLWLFQLLHIFVPPFDWVATMAIPGLVLAFLALLPWMDHGRDPSVRSRRMPLMGLAGVLGGIGALTLYAALAPEPAKASADTASSAPEARRAVTVSPLEAGMLYGEKCTECHLRSGGPNDPDAPDFREADFARMGRQHYDELVKSVKEGGDIMPPFGDELSDAQIHAILDQIVLKFADAPRAPAEPPGRKKRTQRDGDAGGASQAEGASSSGGASQPQGASQTEGASAAAGASGASGASGP